MNPLLWRGPDFLLFYGILAAAALLLQWIRRQQYEEAASDKASRKPNLNDPYEMAYLRGGKNELLRVATVSLIERRLLQYDELSKDGLVKTVPGGPKAANPIDSYLLRFFEQRQPAHEVLKVHTAALPRAVADYQRLLEDAGQLRDSGVRKKCTSDAGFVIGGLLTLAGLKIAVALSTGHRNIGFLVLFALAASGISIALALSGRLTTAGKQSVDDMQMLCLNLRGRQGLSPAEVALLTAVFGVSAMSASGLDYGKRLYPQASASSCGSSGCGSSSSSCGSDGGGGGCGGGGCGGCGS